MYKPIRWNEQRRQYKLDFESEYPVYLRLKENVDAVKIKFKELQDEYNNTKRGTPDHTVSRCCRCCCCCCCFYCYCFLLLFPRVERPNVSKGESNFSTLQGKELKIWIKIKIN